MLKTMIALKDNVGKRIVANWNGNTICSDCGVEFSWKEFYSRSHSYSHSTLCEKCYHEELENIDATCGVCGKSLDLSDKQMPHQYRCSKNLTGNHNICSGCYGKDEVTDIEVTCICCGERSKCEVRFNNLDAMVDYVCDKCSDKSKLIESRKECSICGEVYNGVCSKTNISKSKKGNICLLCAYKVGEKNFIKNLQCSICGRTNDRNIHLKGVCTTCELKEVRAEIREALSEIRGIRLSEKESVVVCNICGYENLKEGVCCGKCGEKHANSSSNVISGKQVWSEED